MLVEGLLLVNTGNISPNLKQKTYVVLYSQVTEWFSLILTKVLLVPGSQDVNPDPPRASFAQLRLRIWHIPKGWMWLWPTPCNLSVVHKHSLSLGCSQWFQLLLIIGFSVLDFEVHQQLPCLLTARVFEHCQPLASSLVQVWRQLGVGRSNNDQHPKCIRPAVRFKKASSSLRVLTSSTFPAGFDTASVHLLPPSNTFVVCVYSFVKMFCSTQLLLTVLTISPYLNNPSR